MSYLIMILGVVFAFGLVIFVHEFGHFIVAKKSGVQVDQFSFGFGREIIGFNWGETRYTINWIPLGGYVKMAGEQPEDYEGPVMESGDGVEKVDKSREFMNKPWTIRTLIALAGPVMNYVLAVFIFFGVFLFWGEAIQTNKAEIGEVFPGLPAEAAGFQPGDSILSIDSEPVVDFSDIKEKIEIRAGQDTAVIVQRGDETLPLTVTPAQREGSDEGIIGIKPAIPEVTFLDVGFVKAATLSVSRCYQLSALTLSHLWEKITAREKPDLAGPIGISTAIVKAIQSGIQDFLILIGYLSIAIGLFNLFPIPLLDGGHVVYYVIEGIRRKPVPTAVMNKANFVGFAFLIGLFLFATMNDLTRGKRMKEEAPAITVEE